MWIHEEYLEQVRLSLAARETLFDDQSEFQRVEVHDTLAYGKVLVLDGVFHTSVRGEHTYHELIAHPAMALAPSIERVLIVGGGDGGTAREVLRYASVEQAVMVELDEVVVRACQQHIPEIGQRAWEDPRLDLRFADAVAHVRDVAPESYDLILVDGGDPVGPSQGLFGHAFFEDCARALRPGGLYVMQSGAPFLMPDVFYPTVAALAEVFGQAKPVFGAMPLYASGLWSWTIAGAEVAPQRAHFDRSAPFLGELRTYSHALHRAAFVPPAEVARRLNASA